MITIYQIEGAYGPLENSQKYEDIIGWLWRHSDTYQLIEMRTDYTNDKPSKMVIAYKVIRE